MNELEVGMYVRTKNEIVQIDKILNGVMEDTKGHLHFGDFIKASYNIIDLIEVGDIVKLFMEDDIDKEDTNIFELVAVTTDKKQIGVFNSDFQIEFFPIENLRGILTKEQFSQMEYKVEQ